MAKAKGPLFSVTAKGSIGRAINFRGTPANPIVSLHRSRPSKPSAAAAENRLAAAHAASTWRALDASTQQAWGLKAAAAHLPPFGYYLQQWQRQGATLTTPPHLPEQTV